MNKQDIYEKRKQRFKILLERQKKSIDLISNARLIVFGVGLIAGIVLYNTENFILFTTSTIVALIIFIYLMIRHSKLMESKKSVDLLHTINVDCIKRINGQWNEFKDTGEEFIDNKHNFSYDLDIFGKKSVYQWINNSKTYLGRLQMKNNLTKIPDRIEDISKKQNAIKEVATRLSWRQRFYVEALKNEENFKNPEDLINWTNEENSFFNKKSIKIITKLLPILTIATSILSLSTTWLSLYIPLVLLGMQYILLRFKKSKIKLEFILAEGYVSDIQNYYKMLKQFEKYNFKSEYINELSDNMKNSKGKTAYKQLERLYKIIDSILNRHNAIYILLNIIFMLDYSNMIKLQKWKLESGKKFKIWIESLGKLEVISSLSNINYDNPDWTMPTITKDKKVFIESKEMGHPLLNSNRVCNYITIKDQTRGLLITGSNMSGKSTYLRSAGLNMVLAYAGVSVCAKEFKASLMDIHTCMRVSDDLGEGISSFYAELLRIKTIVEKVKIGKPVFFLLDEIFKGTNSRDRHIGAKVLINEIIKDNVIGLVSTHDLELCELEEDTKEIVNYHFEEKYKNNKILFDYKLKNGVSKTRNAIYLMRMAGIDIKES